MANLSFAAAVGDFAKNVPKALEAVFRASASQLSHELDDQLDSMIYETPASPNYKRTRFLQASLVASTTDMPRLNLSNPGTAARPDFGQIELVISDMEIGQTLYLGYTAEYGAYVHFGTSKMPPRPWVTLVAQRWQQIVTAQAKKVKDQFGL